jgi:hypothetical protein
MTKIKNICNIVGLLAPLTYRKTPVICTGFAPVSSSLQFCERQTYRETAPDRMSAISLTFVNGRIGRKRCIWNKQSQVQGRHGPQFKAQSCINTCLPFSNRQLSFSSTHTSCRVTPGVTLGAWYSSREPTNRNSVFNIKLTLEQTTKAQRGSRGISLLFL